MPQKLKLYLNFVWMETQMVQRKLLVDIGPEKPGAFANRPYYRMEYALSTIYHPKRRLWGWGLAWGKNK
jgi:hypothetical protein